MAVCSIRSSPAETIGGHHDRTRQTSSATLGDSRLRPVARIQHSVSEPDRADPADRRVLQVIEPGLARPDRGYILAARAGRAASQLRLGDDRRHDQRGVQPAGRMGVDRKSTRQNTRQYYEDEMTTSGCRTTKTKKHNTNKSQEL